MILLQFVNMYTERKRKFNHTFLSNISDNTHPIKIFFVSGIQLSVDLLTETQMQLCVFENLCRK